MMTDFMVLMGVCAGVIGWLCWFESHGDSESAREIKALCRKQRKEALRAGRKYPYTVAGCRH